MPRKRANRKQSTAKKDDRERSNSSHSSHSSNSSKRHQRSGISSPILDYREYKRILHTLNGYDSIDKLAAKGPYAREFLFVIYTQKRIRHITKNYYRVAHKAPQMRRAWDRGRSFIELARDHDFSPVLTVGLVLRQNGYTKRMVKNALHHPENVNNRRIRREVRDVLEADLLYSPEGNRLQAERGRKGEAVIADWLDREGIEYRTEEDLRGEYPKTPDFLIDSDDFHVRGNPIHWVESKGSFGDAVEVKRNLKNQLIQYRELFGPGMVIYHYGFVSNVPMEEDILMATADIMENWRE